MKRTKAQSRIIEALQFACGSADAVEESEQQEKQTEKQPESFNMEDPSFLELKNLPKAEPSASTTCPQDQKQGCSFVDALLGKSRGKANLFLSWVWQYCLLMRMSRMAALASREAVDLERTFMWVCWFCNN